MNDVPRMRVVVIEHMRADAVDESGVHDVESFLTAENAGLRRAGKRRESRHSDADCFVPRSTNRASHPIEQRARRFLAYRCREVGELSRNDVVRKLFRNLVARGVGAVGAGLWSEWRQAQSSGCEEKHATIDIGHDAGQYTSGPVTGRTYSLLFNFSLPLFSSRNERRSSAESNRRIHCS